ncbi:4Fe-4S dicluster domain-containing protein [candidate division KSB1 bacterium]|nr:4Fe-4S dicluster domain-containing protein [candidate division KSB1 bacterium]
MLRQIIQIDESLCNGCGNCITGCAEGALALVNGKAKLVKTSFCDGFGDCIGTCPTGALTIETREVEEFDVDAVKAHLLTNQGIEALWRMEDAHQRHQAQSHAEHLHQGCPGAQMRILEPKSASAAPADIQTGEFTPHSELQQWPVHFRLVAPTMPVFQNKTLVLMSTCGPLAYADIHRRYLRDRSVIVGCPKLDDTSSYVSKLTAILKNHAIPRIIVVRMEVPCCGGLTAIAKAAAQACNRPELVLEEHILSVDGEIKDVQKISFAATV